MLKAKKIIAFILTVVMTVTCMPVSLASDGDNQVTDTVRNPDVILIPKEEQKAEPEETAIPELLELAPEDLSVSTLPGDRLESLKALLPQEKRNNIFMLWFAQAMNLATPPKNETYVGYAAFDIAMAEPEEAGQYLVNVQLNNPIEVPQEENAVIDRLTCELFHIRTDENGADYLAETITGENGLNVSFADGRITGFSFPTEGFSEFVLRYTVEFHYLENEVFACEIHGAQDILLSAILEGIGVAADGDTAAFMAGIETVTASNPEAISVTEAENNWIFRVLKAFDTEEALVLLMEDGSEIRITVAATGITQITTEDNTAVISTVDDYYLPGEASAFAEIREGTEEDAAVAAVQEAAGTGEQNAPAAEQAAVAEEQPAYQVLNIGLENVETENYEGFDVTVNLDSELVGRDFRLYEVQDGQATDITESVQLSADTLADGSQNVQGFSFTTSDFAEYVLSYSLVTYYTAFDGQTFQITLNYGPEAGIPEGAELKVREILQEEEAYSSYLNESAEKLGISSSEVAFARFFDIEIRKDDAKVEPVEPVQVTIAYEDQMPMGEEATLSVVHFADEGTEVITDVAVTEDNREITYEQGSFSVTGTIVTGGNPSRNTAYVVVIQDPATNKYYVVQNDGSLEEVNYNQANNTVTMDYPIMWTYAGANDGLNDNAQGYNQANDHPEWDPQNLRMAINAREYDWNQLANGFYYRYISPREADGIDEESERNDHTNKKWYSAIRYQNNKIVGVSWNGSSWVSNNNYIGADFTGMHITGQNSEGNAARVFMAQPTNVPDLSGRYSNNETVGHIDIAIIGEGVLDVPLAYGDYYDANGNVILTVSAENNVTLHLTQNVDINKEDIMRASISAYDKYGNELNDAFYITGYSANQQTDHSAVQVRMEGSFKVDTLRPYRAGWGEPGDSNANSNRKAERLQNQIYYRISTNKEVRFDFVDPSQNIPQLYDRYGNKLSANTKVSMSAGFSYWDENNECPPVLADFETKYGMNPGNPGNNNRQWKSGAIIDNCYGNTPELMLPGESGMDFVLGNREDSQGKTLAVEIVKIIEDPAGTRIHPNTDIANDFSLYRNPNGSPDSVANYAISPDSVPSSSINYSGYNWFRNHTIVVGQDGIGVLYDYDVEKGMYYVSEDNAPMASNGNNYTITDTNGQVWRYKETRIETEYVKRQDSDGNKRHAAEGYSGVPEVLGPYGNGRNNEFLEFYMHNIYEPVSGSLEITKAISPSTFNPGNSVFTFEVTLMKNGSPYQGNVIVTDRTRTEESAATDQNGKLTVSVTGAGTATITNIPPDITYEVTENVPDGWAISGNIQYENATKTITTDGTDIVTVTNTPITDVDHVDDTVTVAKKDEKNGDLKGAIFTLYDGETKIRTYGSAEASSFTISTADDGVKDLLPAVGETKTLTLKETTAPEGYVLGTNTYSVVISASAATAWNTSHTALVTTTTYTMTIAGGESLTVPNTPVTDVDHVDDTVTVTKEDEKHTALKGAIFTLYDGTEEVGTYGSAEASSFTISTADDGVKDLLPVVGETKTLTLKETTAPEGYVLGTNTYSVVISASAATAWNTDHTKLVTTTTYTMTIADGESLTVPNTPVTDVDHVDDTVTVTKEDEKHTALKGAIFTLYDGTEEIRTYGSAEASSFTISTADDGVKDLLPAVGETKTLTLKETTAPEGYALSANTYSVVISASAATAWNSDHTKLVTTTTYTMTIADGESLTVPNTPITDVDHVDDTVTVAKKDEKNGDLKGAIFTLYDGETKIRTYGSAEASSFTISTADDGVKDLLPAVGETKTLTLKETTAPEGYVLGTNTYSVVISASAATAWNTSHTALVTTTTYTMTIAGGESLTVPNTPVTDVDHVDDTVTVTKEDEKHTALKGAIFTLYDGTEEVGTYGSAEASSFTISTADDGVKDLLPVVGETKTLTLKETTAPEGYVLGTNTYSVVISASAATAWNTDHTKLVTTTTYTMTIADGESLTVPNTPVTDVDHVDDTVTVTKEDEKHTALKGAIFTLYDGTEEIRTYGSAEASSFTISTADDGVKDLLPAVGETKTLTLKETTAPEGYALSANTYSVVISASAATAWNSDHTKLVTTTTYTMTIADGESLTVPNTPITDVDHVDDTVTVAKKDEKNGDLKGAIFTLYDGETKIRTYGSAEASSFTISTADDGVKDLLPAVGETKTLTLKETTAPEGYVLGTNTYSVVISASAATAWNTSHTALVTTTTYTMTIAGGESLTVPNTPVTDVDHVDDTVTVTKEDEKHTALKGAIFTLYDGETVVGTYGSADVSSFTISTADDGVKDLLPAVGETKTLTLKETTAPEGYVLGTNTYSVVISASAATAWNTDHTKLVTTTTYTMTIAGGESLTVPNTPVTDVDHVDDAVTVYKEDEKKTALKGAIFTLYDGETAIGTYGFADVSSFEISTADDGVKDLLPAVGGTKTLTLKETTAPEGYVLSTNTYSVVITASAETDWNTSHTALVTTTTYSMTIAGAQSSEDGYIIKNYEVPKKKEITPYEGTGVLGGVHVGDEITYEIHFWNYKAEAADVVINDMLDVNVEFIEASDEGGYDENTHVVTWTFEKVEAGTEGTVTLTVKVLEGALESKGGEGKVVNGGDTATVKVGNDHEFTLDTVENPVPEEPHKQETAPYEGNGVLGGVHVGDEITYEITYKNYKAKAADVVIKDKLDPNVEFVSADNGGTLADGVVTWKLESVEAGTEGKVTLTVKVLESALESEGGPGKVVNDGDYATVKVGNDSEFTLDTVENPVPEEPHKQEITPYEGNGVLGGVHVGDEITYEITYKNYKAKAADVVIKDKLDPNVEFVSADNGGTLADGIVTWKLEGVEAGVEGKVTLTVKVLEGALESKGGPGKVVNDGDTATVKVGNDHEFTLDTVENPVPEEPHKQETAPYEGNGVLGGVHVGDEITYEITYKNYKAKAADVVIKDKLDPNVEFVSADNDGELADGVVTWKLEGVEAGAEGKVILTVKVLEGALESKGGPGKVVNDGDYATVKVGNDSEFTLDTVENPVPEEPHKQETAPYEGNGVLGGVHVGDEITYEITYKNYKAKAADVVIKDKLDPNVEFVSADNGGTLADGVVTWKLEDVEAGAEGKVTLTVKVLEGALESEGGPGKVVNDGDYATVKVGNDHEFTLDTVENPVPEEPHKQETAPYEGNGVLGGVKVGDEITYEITYKNYKAEAADVVIKDKLDPNVEFVSADNGGTLADGVVTWKLEGVEAGAEGKVTLTVKVLESALESKGGPGKVVNDGDTATVKVGNDHEFTLDTVENPVPEEPHKQETAPYEGNGVLGGVHVGDEITYEITYKNYKAKAADVVIKDKLDPNVEFVSADNGGTLADGIVTWKQEGVEAGAEGKVTLTVKVLESALESEGGPGKVVNDGDYATVKVGNDHEFTLDTVENPVPEEPHKQETAPYEGNGVLGGVHVGDEITYEISYKNYKAEAADVIIKDTLDPNVEFVSADNGGELADGVVTWKLEGVEAGAEGKVTLTVKVLESALESSGGPGKVVNGGDTATVKVGNDHEFTLNTVENPVPEEPHKQETAPYEGTGVLGGVKVGDEITYEITYKNYKAEAATVTIRDTLDKNVEFVSASNGGTLAEGIVTWTLEAVPAGREGKVTLTVKVLPGALVSNGGPGNVINNGDTATVKVGNDHEFKLDTVENPVPEEPVKQETAPYEGTGVLGGVHVGDEITYEISYKNYKAEAADVIIKDTLDPNVEFVSADNGGELADGVVTWKLEGVEAGAEGKVTLTVKVLESALESSGGPGKVVNGGDTATVKVGNDHEFTLNTVENPVPEEPHKQETAPYEGTGVLGGVKVGDEITYEITYKNYKAEAATVTIRDTLDKNVEFVSASNGGTLAEGIVTWTLEAVPAGREGKVTLTVKVLPGALVSNGGPGNVINNGDTATVKVGNDHEFKLDTVENPVPEEPVKQETAPYEGTGVLGGVHVGDEITYEISYKNYKAEAADVIIKDTLDPNVEFVSADNGGELADGVVTWKLEGVEAGAEGKVTLTVKVLESALESSGGPGKVVNGGDTATVKVGNDHEFTLNTVENPVPEEPHKQETAPYEGTGVLGGVKVGDEITYEITYKNYKAEAATVTIRDTLDKNVEFVSASNGGTLAEGIVTWTLEAVPAGREGKVTLTVKVLPGALVSNGGPGNVINNGDTATVKVGNDHEFKLDTVENPVPEEPVKKETAPYEGTGILGGVHVGDEITYEISYKNYKAEAADVIIKDTLDPNVEFVSADNDGTLADGIVTWTIAKVEVGAEGKVTLTVKVLEGAQESEGGPGKVVNGGDTATVKVGNDHEFTLNTVENPVPEEPHKQEISPYTGNGVLGGVKVGDEITYEITYKNYKAEAATVTIRDKLDKNVEFVSASNGGTLAEGIVTWKLAAVPAGREGKVTLTVKVLPGALVSNGGPGNVINNGDTATVQVGNDHEFMLDTVENPVPEEPEKKEIAPYEGTGVLGDVQVGDEITYEIFYRNYKNEAADVIIKDKLDPNVEFVSADNGGTLAGGVVTWTLKAVPAGKAGKVRLTVKVLKGAMVSAGGNGTVANGGDTATVQVGNDHEFTLNTVENPVPDTVSVHVVKIWDDEDNKEGLRPVNLRVTLSTGKSYILNAANNWSVTVSGLPAKKDGKPIVYTWSEQSVIGYTNVETRIEGNTTIFVNRYRPVTPPPAPGQPGKPHVTFEEYETPLGVDVGINHVGDCYE